MMKGLVSSSNPERYASGSTVFSKVSQARQIKREEVRQREMLRRREL
jgi:hypothetical protein